MVEIRTGWTAESMLAFLSDYADELPAMGIRRIGLFGSYVRGEQQPDSDMDFLFTMDDFTWRRWMEAWNFLEDHPGVKVDLVPEKDLRPELRSHVLPEVRYAQGL
ncbi:MAG: nucleotidyltransferase domain-containing protein [Chloroflexi bacterium]|nr:nucleotidyltransferase domain-containing protein [Chloroflexota bacterium]